MNILIGTDAPTFHSLNGTQPVGITQVAVRADWAGTITTVKRTNESTWTVVTRSAKGAFTAQAEPGASAHIWYDRTEDQYVVDYWGAFPGMATEVDRCRTLAAAIGVAAGSTALRWAHWVRVARRNS